MNIRGFGKATLKSVRALEALLDIKLPPDYKDFLLHFNGGNVKPSPVRVKVLGEKIFPNCLFGFPIKGRSNLTEEGSDILDVNAEFADDLVPGTVLIGDDLENNFLLLDSSDGGCVYYYDHMHLFKRSSHKRNTFLIADSFSEFIAMIK